MSGSRWQSFGPFWNQLQQFQGEMNRLVERLGESGARGLGLAGGYPAVNVWEEGEQVVVEAELPGLDPNDLDIYVTGGNQLTLKGQRRQPNLERGVWHRQERGFGAFVRVLDLPFPVNPDRVDARFENGVLHVKLAKHESARPRKINVKG